jgi:glutathione S-transferase
MRLFDFRRAPNPRRARIFIAEKGLDIERIPVDLYRMEQLSPEFLALNPAGTVPVLETDDGIYLTETVAICHYLECLYPDPALMGRGPSEQALVLMWNNIVEHNGIRAIAETLRNWSPGFRHRVFPGTANYEQIPALIDRGRRRTEQFFDFVEPRLASSRYLAGDTFSLADISLLVTTDFAGWVEIAPQDNHPALERWYAEVTSRPSISS